MKTFLILTSIIALSLFGVVEVQDVEGLWIARSTEELVKQSTTIVIGNVTSINVINSTETTTIAGEFDSEAEIPLDPPFSAKSIHEYPDGSKEFEITYVASIDELSIDVEKYIKNIPGFDYDTINVRAPHNPGAPGLHHKVASDFELGDRVLLYLPSPPLANPTYALESFLTEDDFVATANGKLIKVNGGSQHGVIENSDFRIEGGTLVNVEQVDKLGSMHFEIEVSRDVTFDTTMTIQIPKSVWHIANSNCDVVSPLVLVDGTEVIFSDSFEQNTRIIEMDDRGSNIELLVPGPAAKHTTNLMYGEFCLMKEQGIFLSPKKQSDLGFMFYNIQCKEELTRIYKSSDNSPACVTPSTAEKLIERGWIHPEFSHDDASKLSDNDNITNTLDHIDTTNLTDANNQFALNFYAKVSQESDENVFFSPWSIMTAFAIANEGAKGNTATEMQNVFGISPNKAQRQNDFKSVNDDLNKQDSDYDLQIANALWLANSFEPLSEYKDTVKTFYDGKVQSVNFVGNEGVDTINSWVSEKTNEKISEILPKDSTDDLTRLVITNAIYFKGTWVTQFDEAHTRTSDFMIDSETMVKANMMNMPKSPHKYGETYEIKILELPYKGDKISMLILLPNETDGIDELEESLTLENIERWRNSVHVRDVMVSIPKFTLSTDYDLTEPLMGLGLTDAFDAGAADFSGITNIEQLYINSALHKAFVDVNEEGTEAAAVTSIGVGFTSVNYPTAFIADHPFLFLIQDNDTGNILFLGKISDPDGLSTGVYDGSITEFDNQYEQSESSIEDEFGDLGGEHAHAGILVRIFGDKFDFSAPAYQIKSSWIHFEGQDGNTVHRHASGVTLGYLFDTLELGLTDQCYVFQDGRSFCTNDEYKLKFFINGERHSDIRDYEINENDRILITYGNENEIEIGEYLQELNQLEIIG